MFKKALFMPKEQKSTETEVRERVNFILPLISIMTRKQILDYVKEKKTWNVTNTQIDLYVRKAKDLLKADFKEQDEMLRENVYNNLRFLYLQALNEKDLRLCLSITDRMLKLFGLINPVVLKEWEFKEKQLKIDKKQAENILVKFGNQDASEFIKNYNESLKDER